MKSKLSLQINFFAVSFFTCVFAAVSVSAQNANPSPCDGPDIIKIERPYNSQDPHSPRFTYRFQLIRGTDPQLAPVIFLPGGPGGVSIGPRKNPPSPLTYIYTDPRGAGCNDAFDKTKLAEGFYSTAEVASDVLAIIHSQGLQAYILRGQSYGTYLATVIAGRAEQGEAPVPTGLILEGTLGHAFQNQNVYAGFQQQWEAFKTSLPAESIAAINAGIPVLPDITADEWGRALAMFLIIGPRAISDGIDLNEIFLALSSQKPEGLSAVHQLIKSFGYTPPEESALYRNIMCKELTDTDNVDFALIDGKLVGNRNPGFCNGLATYSVPYDSRQHLTSAPIYYFQGDKDPATTIDQALYHFTSQTKATRYFTEIKDGSHILGGILKPCMQDILISVARKGQNFEAVLKTCGSPLTTKKQVPERAPAQ